MFSQLSISPKYHLVNLPSPSSHAGHSSILSTVTYNANKPTEEADRGTLTNPFAISEVMSKAVLNDMASQEPERFDALERAGFKTERYGNIQEHILVRLGGHYMDVGASKMVADGLV